eukprot:6463084-Pyramimonas_sp.AAC.1
MSSCLACDPKDTSRLRRCWMKRKLASNMPGPSLRASAAMATRPSARPMSRPLANRPAAAPGG